MPMPKMFDFINADDKAPDETATGGNPTEEIRSLPIETATGGNQEPLVHQGLTKAQILTAQRLSESKKGLDMSAFMKETGLANIDFEELLKYKVK
jgi:hypothetical protein